MKQHEPNETTPTNPPTSSPSEDGRERAPRVRLRAEKPAKSVMGNLMLPPHVRRHAT